VAYPLPADARMRWAEFPLQFLIWALPAVCGFFLLSWAWIGEPLEKRFDFLLPSVVSPAVLILLGVTWAVRIAFRYHGEFRPRQVHDLLEDMAVSQMKTRAVELKGEIVGNGVPGAFWSPDLVLKDETGLMFIYYRSSIPFGRFWFALANADRFIGEQATVRGWYRRGLRPYVELSTISATVNSGAYGNGPVSPFAGGTDAPPEKQKVITSRSYSRWIQMAGSAAATAAGLIWLLAW